MTPYLQILAALTAFNAPAQSVAFVPGTAIHQRPSIVVEVANHRRPYHAVNRHNDRGNDTGDAQVEQLNQMSLQRAQQGQNAPGSTPDTTSNLNSMSGQDATRGQNTGGRPMLPFK